ncbi:MAG: J domain-containing protein [Alphaproteobacteria bacterium]|nr:J domain-containing protein [Alphaproteobacteria bacterium]MBL0717797.1 J domain-containing protein [Alphaproteobacteria bacterium]
MTKRPDFRRRCDAMKCSNAGEFKAPKNRGLKDHWYFCLKHVKEYNKSWNYYKGLSDKEIEAIDFELKVGLPLKSSAKSNRSVEENIEQFLFFKNKKVKTVRSIYTETLEIAHNIFKIEQDCELENIKKEYLKLVKKYHPDKNKDIDKKFFAGIVEAYKFILDSRKIL